jgi:hypothetical protein
VSVGIRSQTYRMLDISIGGMRLSGKAPGPQGANVSVTLGSQQLRGIARQSDQDFAIQIEQTIPARTAHVRFLLLTDNSQNRRAGSLQELRRIFSYAARSMGISPSSRNVSSKFFDTEQK